MILEEIKEELCDDINNQLLELYDFPDSYNIQLLKYSENIIFKITFPEGKTNSVVFRVHRPGYHDLEELKSEMIWMEEISKDTDISLPLVYRGRNGEILQSITTANGEKVNCSVISFLEGKVIGELSGEDLVSAIEQVGEITAKLHLQAINRDKSVKLKRFSWDIHNFFDEDGVWGSWRDYPNLSSVDYSILELCEKKIITLLDKYGRTVDKYGLIHADLHFFNIIQKDGINQIFDFDDSGYGFFMYDLGCTLVTYSDNLDELVKAWVRGYEKNRKLSDEDRESLPMFVLLRRIVRIAWLASHWNSDTQKSADPKYLQITVDMAKDWLEGNR